ncbi:MAG: A/G-specific adenine glycosylase [Anaerolineaceae bacterium]|nr:A/G-specific adenine glycosylase [Anaerolineaceae bacterium]
MQSNLNNAPKIANQLLDWYNQNARDLPWRSHPQPYNVLVSEIMLQQTRMETVLPYYQRWMTAFPTLKVLAESELQEVLKLWEGLGFYGRARNLHKAAKIVLSDFNGQIPKTQEELESLPGIGRYTAAAIASISFGADEAALDGNIRRILSRLFNIEEPIRSAQAEEILWGLAESLLPDGKAGDFNQALMDLGSLVCTSRNPSCSLCPLQKYCTAFGLGIQEERPVNTEKKTLPHKLVAAAIIHRADGLILIAQRPEKGLYGGLWEFPGGKKENGETLQEALVREIQEELEADIHVGEEFGSYQHTLSHFRFTLYAFHCTLIAGSQPKAIEVKDFVWVNPYEMKDYPMGKIDRLIAEKLLSETE